VIDIGAVMQGVQIGVEAIPLVVGLIDGLVKAGQMSESDAAIVRTNIESRRVQYMRQKAEDERALSVKHGTPDELADGDITDEEHRRLLEARMPSLTRTADTARRADELIAAHADTDVPPNPYRDADDS
jgi:hypothetical protein